MIPSSPVILDSTPLGALARAHPRPEDLQRLSLLVSASIPIYISELVDYEVRRNLLLHNLAGSLRELDGLKSRLLYTPITTAHMLRAAELWADARRRGRPTADPREIDGDVILAAQAMELGATVLTENVGHLSQFVPTLRWQDISA